MARVQAVAEVTRLAFVAYGQPVPQGSNKAFNNRIVASNGDRLKPWRNTIASAALDASLLEQLGPFRDPVVVYAAFYFTRPKHHYRSGKHAHLLKDLAPHAPSGRGTGDLDKHQRAIGDALVDAGVLQDDSLITTWRATKRWCAPDAPLQTPGAVVEVALELPR